MYDQNRKDLCDLQTLEARESRATYITGGTTFLRLLEPSLLRH